MKFYSTNDTSLQVNLKEAVLNSLPKDRGLYMPEEIAILSDEFWESLEQMTFPEIAFRVSRELLKGDINDGELQEMVEESINFEAPLKKLSDNLHLLELFHGPTLAFKDFGARFMAQLMGKLTENDTDPLTILVATSGDTGGAVASGFYKVKGIRVFILYPSGRVSPLQEKQLTTLGANIQAFEIDGSFDDCQALVKQAFLDEELNQYFNLTSANSINIARLIPQSFYYFRAYQQLLRYTQDEAVFCIPSGNFGNLTAGLIAKRMGLPVKKFLAATNINDIVPKYLETGLFEPKASIATLSNAMDVGNPSNFSRMKDLFQLGREEMQGTIIGYSYSDEETSRSIAEVNKKFDYTIDPHGAIGILAAQDYLKENPQDHVIVLGTAHPAKFPEAVFKATGTYPEIPERLGKLAGLKKESIKLIPDFEVFRGYLMEQIKKSGK